MRTTIPNMSGPNITRLLDSAVGESLTACVVAGPGDLLFWEVRLSVDADGVPLEVSGRGTDLESAAGAATPVMTAHVPSASRKPS